MTYQEDQQNKCETQGSLSNERSFREEAGWRKGQEMRGGNAREKVGMTGRGTPLLMRGNLLGCSMGISEVLGWLDKEIERE